MPEPVMTLDEVRVLKDEYIPTEPGLAVRAVGAGGVVFTVEAAALSVRPGGTVSGPAIFAFADVAGYLAVSAHIGPTPGAVLTSSNVSFLEAVEPQVLTAVVEAVRIGRRVGVFTVRVDDDQGVAVAIATLHFAFPTRRRG